MVKMKRKLLGILVFSFLLMVSLWPAEADITEGSSVSISSEIAIYGEKIVFAGETIVNHTGELDVFLYDLKSSELTQITGEPGRQEHPDIYGNVMVWLDCEEGKNDELFAYDISNGTEWKISENSEIFSPKVFGDRIVWFEKNKTHSALYMYKISDKTRTLVMDNGYGDYDIWEDRLIYVGANSDIWMKNLSTGEVRRITNISYTSDLSPSPYSIPKNSPRIWGDTIVWVDYRNDEDGPLHSWGNPDIYMYNLSTGIESPVCTNYSEQGSPAVYGKRILWYDTRNAVIGSTSSYGIDIYLYDLSLKTEKRLTDGASERSAYYNPEVYKNTAVWVFENEDTWGALSMYVYNFSTNTGKSIELVIKESSNSPSDFEFYLILTSMILIMSAVVFVGVRYLNKRGKRNHD